MTDIKPASNERVQTVRSTNDEGYANLVDLAVHLPHERPRNAATTFAVRCLVREASLKAAKKQKTRVHYISPEALDLRRRGENQSTVREHVTPLALAVELTKRQPPPGVKELSDAIELCQTVAVITRAEDMLLRSAGLVKTMPQGWNGGDPFARYDHVGIPLLPCPPDIRR